LENAIRRVSHVVNDEIGKGEQGGLHLLLDSILAGHDRVSIWVGNYLDEPLAADSEIAFPKELMKRTFLRTAPGVSVLFEWQQDGHQYRGVATQVRAESLFPAPLKVAAAMSLDQHTEFLKKFHETLWVAIGSAIVVSLLISIGIAQGGLRSLTSLARQMDEISSQRLNRRLRIDFLPLDLVGLAEAFNAMLGRLDASFARLSEFSADIAHELRTPVSNLLTQTQVMLSGPRSVEEYRDVLASNAEELERLSRMVSDMLFLAKTDNAPRLTRTERVDVEKEVSDLFEFYEALAAEKSIDLRLNGALAVTGDRAMLRRALNNLLSNAVRYTATGGCIEVDLERDGNNAVIKVTNPGEPIPEALREQLFERFYRADTARARDTEGAGLGLAIVKAIARSHGGGVSVTSTRSSNTFAVWFPLQKTNGADR